MQRYQIRLDPQQRAHLDRLKEQTGAPVSVLIRRAIAAYLAYQDTKGDAHGHRRTRERP